MLHGPLIPKGTPPEEDPTEELEVLDKVEHSVGGQAPAKPTLVTSSNLFRHHDAHPVILDLLLLKKYGPDWLGWEPETLEIFLPEDFHCEVSALNLSKIQACKSLHLVDDYWHRWEVFLWVTMALNGVFPDFKIMQVPTVAQCMVSVSIANQIRADVEWSSEIKAYLSAVHIHDGIFVPQSPLDFVHVDGADYPVDTAEVRKNWPFVVTSGKSPSAETATAEQLRRMLHVYQLLQEDRASFRSQLPLVNHVPHR
jgi:hypothetical protein